jgi:hypothetical protein
VWEALALWGSGFLHVFLLGFQSRNVQAGRYGWAMATSFALAAAQLVLLRAAVTGVPWELFLVITGTAGPCGIASAMWLTRSLLSGPHPR